MAVVWYSVHKFHAVQTSSLPKFFCRTRTGLGLVEMWDAQTVRCRLERLINYPSVPVCTEYIVQYCVRDRAPLGPCYRLRDMVDTAGIKSTNDLIDFAEVGMRHVKPDAKAPVRN